MKVLLLVPEFYDGFHQTMIDTFEHLGGEVVPLNFRAQVKPWEHKVNEQMFRLPNSMRTKWERSFFKKINDYYRNEYDRIKPDVIFTYNNEMLLPETVAYFKQKSKIAFFLGDHPYYTPSNRHFLSLLFQADGVFTTDTFWIAALHKLGVTGLQYMYPSIPPQHFPKELPAEEKAKLASEVLYVGMCYKTSWGLKKANFLNEFTDFDLQIRGDDSWKRWFGHYPKLKEHYREREGYITVERLNDMYNATKIAPIDANPGLLHAVHWRMLEALGSGALPLMEWQVGVDELFPDRPDIPAVKSFGEAREMTRFYLDNEDKRQEMIAYMTNRINQHHSIEKNAAKLKDILKL